MPANLSHQTAGEFKAAFMHHTTTIELDPSGQTLSQDEHTGTAGAGNDGPAVQCLEESDPPLLTGGSITQPDVDNSGCVLSPSTPKSSYGYALIGGAIDFLTVTIPTDAVGRVLELTEFVEEGRAQQGFKRSELRAGMGFEVWRKTTPYSPSKRWSLDYESWEVAGPGAAAFAVLLRTEGIECRPSHIDYALDFACTDDMLSDHFMLMVKPHLLEHGIIDGVSGQGGVLTCYCGSSSSDRRVRIYRKDLRELTWATLYGPTLRVEPIMRGVHAEQFWRLYLDKGNEGALLVAAFHLAELSGVVVSTTAELPTPVLPAAASPAEEIAVFAQQYARKLSTWSEAGIDVLGICQAHAAARGSRSEVAACEDRRRLRLLREAGPDEVQSLALDILRFSR